MMTCDVCKKPITDYTSYHTCIGGIFCAEHCPECSDMDATPAPQPAPAPDLTEAKLAALENIAANAGRIATALEILCDLLADAMTETTNLTEQDEPTALHMGEALAMGVSICTGGDITRRQLDIRTASRMQMGTDL